jgi:hypothetical protein
MSVQNTFPSFGLPGGWKVLAGWEYGISRPPHLIYGITLEQRHKRHSSLLPNSLFKNFQLDAIIRKSTLSEASL